MKSDAIGWGIGCTINAWCSGNNMRVLTQSCGRLSRWNDVWKQVGSIHWREKCVRVFQEEGTEFARSPRGGRQGNLEVAQHTWTSWVYHHLEHSRAWWITLKPLISESRDDEIKELVVIIKFQWQFCQEL